MARPFYSSDRPSGRFDTSSAYPCPSSPHSFLSWIGFARVVALTRTARQELLPPEEGRVSTSTPRQASEPASKRRRAGLHNRGLLFISCGFSGGRWKLCWSAMNLFFTSTSSQLTAQRKGEEKERRAEKEEDKISSTGTRLNAVRDHDGRLSNPVGFSLELFVLPHAVTKVD